MKEEEANHKICPYLNKYCITRECMFWEETIDKKEIDRKQEPYDMTPYDIRVWTKEIESQGYISAGKLGGFRNWYVKYEKESEGFCTLKKDRKNENG